jgi:hypothetical protein
MSVSVIAKRLVELCRQGEFEAAQNELFADNAVSIEPAGSPAPRVEGLEAIREKGRQFMASLETMHAVEVGDPIVAGNYFSCTMMLDATFQGQGRMKMEEICVYGVRDGKIVSEQFFYDMG